MKNFYSIIFFLTALFFQTSVLYSQTCSTSNSGAYGNGSWIGHVYDHNGSGNPITTPFAMYKGTTSETENFDRNYGTSKPECAAAADNFAIRYRMNKTFSAGTYTFTISGDDGMRLSIDGGSTWILSDWVDHSYRTVSVSQAMSGNYNLVLEYYEKRVDARISFSVSGPACIAPTAPPTSLLLTPHSGTQINGSFTAAVPAATNYLVLRSTSASLSANPVNGTTYAVGSTLGGATVLSNGASTSFISTGLSPNTRYYYFVFSYNATGCTGGPLYSSANPLSGSAVTLCAAPNAPTGFTASRTSNSADISFNAIGAAGYMIIRSSSASAPLPQSGHAYTVGNNLGLGTVISVGNTTTVTDTGLASNTQYYYYIYSYNTGACSNSPVYASSSLSGNIITCPGAPIAKSVSAISQNSATIEWSSPGGIPPLTYAVEVSSNSSFTAQITGSPFSTSATSQGVTGLTAGTNYYYRVRADNGCDGQWLTGSFVTGCAAPVAPSGCSLNLSGGTVSGTIGSPSLIPSGYLIVRSSASVPPVPTNGQTYNTGSSFGGNYVVRGSNTAILTTTFTDVPAAYTYYYVYSFNADCYGAPVYSQPVSARINACAPSSNGDARYISEVKFLGTLNVDTSNATDYYAGGYADYSALPQKAKQIPGGVINLNVNLLGSVNPPTATIKAWVDWDKDGIFNSTESESAGGEKVFDTNANGVLAGNVIFGFVVPSGTAPGLYTIRVRASTTSGIGPCGNSENGETEDYTFEVVADCTSKIMSASSADRCGPGPVTLSAVASSSTASFRWYTSEFGAAISGATAASYTVPSLSVGQHTFYVTAVDGCESAYRTPVKVTVRPTPVITFVQSTPDFCGANNSVIISSTGNKEEVTIFEEKFETDNVNSAVFENITDGNATEAATWMLRQTPFIPAAPYNIVKVALSSGYNGGNFANIITDVRQTTNILNHFTTKSAVNTTGFTDLKLDFDLYYFSEEDIAEKNYLKLQYSLDNGLNWIDLKTYLTDVGVPSRFQSITESLPAVLENQTQLRLRFSLFALGTAKADGSVLEWIVDVVGLDNVRLYGNKDLPASFLWSGSGGELLDDTCSAPVSAMGAPSVCVRLSETELENRQKVTISASAALSNGCSATGTIDVLNKTKFWNISSNEWATTNWKPGTDIPTADNCVIIKKPVTINNTTQGLAKNITVEPSGELQISGSLKVTDFVKNYAPSGAVVIESNASLIQVNEGNTINVGNITAQRKVNVSPGRQQYNYIISPLEGQSLKTIYPNIEYVLYHNETNNFFYNSSGAYIKGRALAVKEPKAGVLPSAKASTVTATFTGYPTNGAFTYNLVNSNTASPKRGYNLVGNPYPSNMDLIQFYHINSGSGNISNAFHLWDNRANSQTVQMGDKYEGQAYAIFHATTPPGEGTGTLATGDFGMAGVVRPTRYIKVGQGFMVKTSVNNQPLLFNNTVRTHEDGPTFFGRTAENTVNFDRFWLNMITPTNLRSDMAVVYFEGGTNGFSSDDAASLGGSDELYSRVDDRKVNINGRSIFTDEDVVPLGTRHFTTGEYRIELAGTEGIFSSAQPVYLKDKLTGAITNLSESAYSFAAEAGESTGRFEIVYKSGGVLATDAGVEESVVVYREKNHFHVRSGKRNITGLQLFDSSGRLVYSVKPNAVEAIIDGNALPTGVYILRIERGGEVSTRKIVR